MTTPKVAYLILAHTDPAQLERLVNAIDYKSSIFIHVDKKSPIEGFLSLNLPSSAQFILDRVGIYWGGLSMVRATIHLIKSALESEENFSHLVLLSGLDYPIKSAKFIYEFLVEHPHQQFIRFCQIERIKPGLRRVSKYWFHDPLTPLPIALDTRLRKISCKFLNYLLPPKTLKGVDFAFGSQWWALTPDCARNILKTLEENPDLLSFFSTSHAPDEIVFHTLVANSQYIDQTEGFLEDVKLPRDLANLHTIKIGKIFTEKDFSSIQGSDSLFIRKVTSTHSSELLKLIDEGLLGIPQQAFP